MEELLKFLLAKGEKYDPVPLHHLSRDPKDNFLLDLADMSQADYLVTGDKDLLELNPFKTTFILTPADFETEVKKIINL